MNRSALLSPLSLAALIGLSACGAFLVVVPGKAAPSASQPRRTASAPAQAAPPASESGEAKRTVRVVYSGVITAR